MAFVVSVKVAGKPSMPSMYTMLTEIEYVVYGVRLEQVNSRSEAPSMWLSLKSLGPVTLTKTFSTSFPEATVQLRPIVVVSAVAVTIGGSGMSEINVR